MIVVNQKVTIDEGEIEMDFVRASGPGGQNVNKVSSAVQLRFDVQNSPSLPEEVRARLMKIAANRITTEGVLMIEAKQFRTQDQNRADAVERLIALVRQAAEKPKYRKPTRPTAESKQRRLEGKRHRSEIKRLRRNVPGEF